ncbi:MAG: MFS transporter [Erysipelotrichaceae bacterium]|nr:MFS transporter [Erysipelotrichaceae bacterium]
MNLKLNFRYSMSQILYCATLCLTIGFASVYLQDKGYSNSVIGIILAMGNVITTIFQPILATYADKVSYKKVNLLIISLLLINACLLGILYFINLNKILFSLLFILILAINLTITPLLNSLSFSFESFGYKVSFGVARGLGSVSYAVFSMGLGILATTNIKIFPLINILMNILCAIFVKLYSIKEIENVSLNKSENKSISLKDFIKKYKKFIILIFGVICVTFGHGLINNFFIQVVQSLNGNSSDMGKAVFIAAIVELPIMAISIKLIRKFKVENVIKFSLFMFMVKHTLTFIAWNMYIIYFAQLLQMFAYALYIPASVYYVYKIIDKEEQITGQSLLNTAITIGSVFASFTGGILIDIIGVKYTLLISALLSVIGFVVAFNSVERT